MFRAIREVTIYIYIYIYILCVCLCVCVCVCAYTKNCTTIEYNFIQTCGKTLYMFQPFRPSQKMQQ